ncbi:putative ripening-related protein [Vigna angularis]|uniref:Putative ripening-related protein n=1 Tax=Phaseolus angularis TaxID=3914 RepID=A0A8T0KPJ6_PHAAN|nr:putative ripening-related protein [Vigna angularis]
MANIVAFVILFCLVNVTTLLTYAASCRSNGAHSPEINPSGTPAILILNDFGRDGDGGGASECDGKFHPLPQRVVALSTVWYSNGARACKNNVVDASETVWNDLGLNTDDVK